MPKRSDIDSILIIGAGPIVIGQACEFDYSGTQAVKALKADGYRIILVNSNPATIMTDPDVADATYIEPITPDTVARIIEVEHKERPDEKLVILPTMGGQTALNTALSLRKMGILDELGVEMIGATADAIDKAEDRDLFRTAMRKIGLETPKAAFVNTSELKLQFEAEHKEGLENVISKFPEGAARDQALAEYERIWTDHEFERREHHRLIAQLQALKASQTTRLPAVVRPSFTLGGTGGGIAYTLDELYEMVLSGVDASPTNEVLVEESVLGWKEFEMEVVRDKDDNCIIICSIENVDPMGIHTGDSITVAPALTLTDKEYQIMRNASIAVLREIGVETGGSNVQFAVNPADGRLVVIEMNPRVSRSSALASKATGFPIAKVAARLAVGYTLDELENEITGGATPAAFEPTIDYVVTKIPRFAFEKFPGAEPFLTTSMKSVGEAMAIGRTFAESLQKALRSLETGLDGLDNVTIPGLDEGDDKNAIRAALAKPTPDRLLLVAEAMRHGAPREQIYESCKIDPWFLDQIADIIAMEQRILKKGLPNSSEGIRQLKAMGFSDTRLSALTDMTTAQVTQKRTDLQVYPVYKRIDTSAAEFASPTAYMYSTYETPLFSEPADEANPSERDKIVILGGGPNRIGQGIEFDYCCCHAAFSLRDAGFETIMVNCNPETVSTDYDTSDRLYFEPLTEEDVMELLRIEQTNGKLVGVIVQFGGQTPLKLAQALTDAGIPILGTPTDAIDLAEDRNRFQKLLHNLNLLQPHNGIARSVEEARNIIAEIGYPAVLRPSYVLGGRGMEIVRDEAQFEQYINTAMATSGDSTLLIDGYLTDAVEVDVDALSDGETVKICGIMEHIEEAGIHSGDSACALPPYSLSKEICSQLTAQTQALATGLGVIGLMNVQFAIKDDQIYVLEVNPRASRTVPFVAKTVGQPIAAIASRIMAGEQLADFDLDLKAHSHIAVKEAVFPFARFPGVDTLLGPEMRSTGEVMGIARRFEIAFAKAQLGAGSALPLEGTAFISARNTDKTKILEIATGLSKCGFQLIATSGTQRFLSQNGISCKKINKVLQGRPHIVDAIKNGGVQMVVNTTNNARAISDSRSLRRAALMQKIPYYTTIAGAAAAVRAIQVWRTEKPNVRSLQAYFVANSTQA